MDADRRFVRQGFVALVLKERLGLPARLPLIRLAIALHRSPSPDSVLLGPRARPRWDPDVGRIGAPESTLLALSSPAGC